MKESKLLISESGEIFVLGGVESVGVGSSIEFDYREPQSGPFPDHLPKLCGETFWQALANS